MVFGFCPAGSTSVFDDAIGLSGIHSNDLEFFWVMRAQNGSLKIMAYKWQGIQAEAPRVAVIASVTRRKSTWRVWLLWLLALPLLVGCSVKNSEGDQSSSRFERAAGHSSFEDLRSFDRKRVLLEEVIFDQSSYAIYADMVSRGHDTTETFGWSVEGIAIEHGGEVQLSLFQKEFHMSAEELSEAHIELSIEALVSDSTRGLYRLDFERSPSAPGQEVIALLQLRPDQIQASELCHIEGYFDNKSWGVDGIRWSGFFQVEWPLSLVERGRELTLVVDTLRLKHNTHGYLLQILKGERRVPASVRLELLDDPFSTTPTFRSLDICKDDSVHLIQLATNDLGFGDLFDSRRHWIQVEVAGHQGWIKGIEDLRKVGCQAAG